MQAAVNRPCTWLSTFLKGANQVQSESVCFMVLTTLINWIELEKSQRTDTVFGKRESNFQTVVQSVLD